MKISDRLNYYFLNVICVPVSLLPLRLLYAFSDLIAFLAHSVVRYRRKVVRENLSSSFPEKDEVELRRIEKEFYRFLSDYFVETIKLATMKPSFMHRHLTVEGIDAVNDAVARGRSVSLYLGHFCNWEWVSSLPLFITPGTCCAQIYHPLRNKGADLFFQRLRTRFHAHNLPMKESALQLLRWKRDGVPTVTGYIADQAPKMNIHLFLDFLNHDTGVFTGPERISRALSSDVFYISMSRPRRGYYHLKFVPITADLKHDPVFGPTRRYFSMLEADIRRTPQYWLWSHRRWKRTRRMFYDYFGDKADEQLSHL